MFLDFFEHINNKMNKRDEKVAITKQTNSITVNIN